MTGAAIETTDVLRRMRDQVRSLAPAVGFVPSQRAVQAAAGGPLERRDRGIASQLASHVLPYADGGPSTITNGQGLCETGNHAKQAPHWTATTTAHGDVITHTPTAHTYRSRAPDPPGTRPPGFRPEHHFRLLLPRFAAVA